MATLAELSVLVGANISGLQSGMNEANRIVGSTASGSASRINQITGALDSVGSKASSIAGQLAGVFAPAGLAMGVMVHTAANFEDSLTELSVRTGTYGDDLERIRQKALELGKDTAFSAQESIDAFLQLVTSGSTVEEAFAQIGPVLDAAAASGEALGPTADIITDIMAAFQLNGDTVWEDGSVTTLAGWTENVVDALARAAGSSSATMGDLGQGFANVGGQAKAFGLDVWDTAGILAIFSENGIKGAEAGTALRSMLTNMSRDTSDVKSAWNSLGTGMYDTAGNMRPLETILEDIRAGMDGKTEQQQNEILQDLAGTYGILGLRALLGGVSMEEMRAKMQDSASATEVAEARMSTFSGSFDQLKGAIETFMINAGTPFIENVLQPLVGGLTDTVGGIADWAAENPGAMSTLLGLVAAGVIAVPVLWAVSAVAGAVSGGIGLISGAVGILGGPGTLALLGTVGAVWLLNQEVGEGVTGFDVLKIGAIGAADEIAMALRRATAKPEDAWLFTAGDDIRNELARQMGEAAGDPIEFSSALEFTIDQNPTAIAQNMSYQARLVLVEAWDRAVEQGDIDFLRDAAPLVAALDHLNLIPSELGEINLDPLKDALMRAWDENLDEIGNEIIKPGSELPINLNQMSFLIEAQGIDPALISTSISNQQIANALELALAAEGPLDLQVPIRFSRLADGAVDISYLDDLLRGASLSPEVLDEIAASASEDMKLAITDALLRAYEQGDQTAIQLLSPVAVAMEIDIQAEAVQRTTRLQLEQAVAIGTQQEVAAAASLAISVGISEAEVLEIQNQHARLVADAINNAPATPVNPPLAIDPAVDTASVVSQVIADLQAQNYSTSVSARVTVDPTIVYGNMPGGATGSGTNYDGTPDTDGYPWTPLASGHPYIPFDNFPAMLHEGEAVLTAQEAPLWRALKGVSPAPAASASGGGVTQHFHITAYGQTPDELARMIKRKMQEQAIGGGVFG